MAECISRRSRGEEGDFVTGMEGSVPGGEFLIAGGDERRSVFWQARDCGRHKRAKKLFDGGGVGGVDRVLGAAMSP